MAAPPAAVAPIGELLRDGAVDPHRLGKDQRTVAPHAPAIEQMPSAHDFAHRGAAEDDGFGEQQMSAAG